MARDLKPYRKIVEDCKAELQAIRSDKNKTMLLFIRFKRQRELQERLNKIESKIASMQDTLSYQDESFQREVVREFESDLKAIAEETEEILLEMQATGWMRGLYEGIPYLREFVRIGLGILRAISWMLGKIGIPMAGFNRLLKNIQQNLLPPAHRGSDQ